ncbi:hypothetical protein Q1695_000590 [Nippostrongylus brasiliensis]|nr:hypothetical protein Q1695_000590 [Nippostrongylus brasiliensis]
MKLLVFACILVACSAQFFENDNGEEGEFIQGSQLGHTSTRHQVAVARIPDIVVERNGDSQFNFGPLGSTAHTHQGNVVQSTSILKAGVGSKKRGGNVHRNGQRTRKPQNNSNRRLNLKTPSDEAPPPQIGEAPQFKITATHIEDEVFESQADDNDDLQHGSDDGFHRFETKTFQDPPARGNNPSAELGHTSYAYPEKQHPLKQCFYNPSGYACCNRILNDEIVKTYELMSNQPDFNPCNTQKIANAVQRACNKKFKMNFETIVGLSDYAQRVNFKKDLVCKVELGGRYMLAYATPEHSGARLKRGESNATEPADKALKLIDRSVSAVDNSTDFSSVIS